MCQDHLSQLRQQETELSRLRTAVLVVTFEQRWRAEAYAQQSGFPWPLLLDTDRTLYQTYGLQRGRVGQVLGPSNWWGYVKLLAAGRPLQWPTDDVYQLGGDVLIDPEGIVRLHHVSRSPVDRLAVTALLDLARQSTRPLD